MKSTTWDFSIFNFLYSSFILFSALRMVLRITKNFNWEPPFFTVDIYSPEKNAKEIVFCFLFEKNYLRFFYFQLSLLFIWDADKRPADKSPADKSPARRKPLRIKAPLSNIFSENWIDFFIFNSWWNFEHKLGKRVLCKNIRIYDGTTNITSKILWLKI